jgi:hypothetical protein
LPRGDVLFENEGYHSYHVIKVIDRENAVIRWRIKTLGRIIRSRPLLIPHGHGVILRNDPDEDAKHVPPETLEMTVWLAAPTAGMTDDTAVDLRGMYMVTGEKEYTDESGESCTIKVISPFDIKRYLPEEHPRTWTDISRKHSITAKLLAVKGDSVELEREDGAVVLVPLQRLCKEDRKYAASCLRFK